MVVLKKRLLFWLIKAYFKKWGKAIFLYFLCGLGIFFILQYVLSYYATKLPLIRKDIIGIVGSYSADNFYKLPSFILEDISQGFTHVGENGLVQPSSATNWKITNNGKTYTFYLKNNLRFSDGTSFTSNTIPLSFKDVSIQKQNPLTLTFHLKDMYAPFLVTVSRPIFKNDVIGIGKYKVKDIQLNGNFITSITLVSVTNPYESKIYQFYPTQDAVKLAFALGELSHARDLSSVSFKQTSFSTFPNTQIKRTVNYHQLVSVFYNTKDNVLSDRKIREALAYTFPDTFPQGERAYSPISPRSFAYIKDLQHTQDFVHAQSRLDASIKENKSSIPSLTLDTLPQYLQTAKLLTKLWEKLGIKTKVEVIDNVRELPRNYQIFLGDFSVGLDPDQYTLWHSDQENNITQYANQRIDKDLEDGRRTIDIEERKKIYADFQKHLADEQPAFFLYFPYSYTLTRK